MRRLEATLKVRRYNPEVSDKPWWESYLVPYEPMDRVLDALHWIKWRKDGSLTFRRSCGHGICGSDAMLINGVNRLACKVLVKDLRQPIMVEALRGMTVKKDLVVDMGPFLAQYRAVLPYFVNDEPTPTTRERFQTPGERARYDDTTKCILCAACTTSCPIYWADGSYYGPAAIVNAHRFIFDSRDRAADDRLRILAEKQGAFRCRTTFNCTDACPRGIRVTRAIQEVKREILNRSM